MPRRGDNREMRKQSFSEQMQDDLEPIIHSKPPEGYIKRRTSTIPFGYELDPQIEGYLKPIPEQIHALSVVSGMVQGDEISLAVAVDWLEASTNRKLSRMGLKKHIDKNYNGREEELKNKFNSILDRF